MSASTTPTESKATPVKYQCSFSEHCKDGRIFLGDLARNEHGFKFETNFDGAISRHCVDGIEILPPDLSEYKDSLKLPSAAIDPGNEPIIPKIIAFIRKYADVPPEWENVAALYVLMSWVYDRFTAVPYIRYLGESGTGKTRMLEILAAICNRSLLFTGNVTGAALFRSIDDVRGTLVVDEADLQSSEAWSDIVKVLNSGYTHDGNVLRCDKDRGFKLVSFCTFGPKVLGTREKFSDDALENRCITFQTTQRKIRQDIPLQLPHRFYAEAEQLRNLLLGWRHKNWSRINPDDSFLRNKLPLRLAQIGTSLLAVAESSASQQHLIDFLVSYGREAEETNVVCVTREAAKNIFETVKEARIADITDAANGLLGVELDERNNWGEGAVKPKRVGSILRSLGCKMKRTKIGWIASPPENGL